MTYETPVAREMRLEEEAEARNEADGIITPDAARDKILSGELSVDDVIRRYAAYKVRWAVPKKDLGPTPSWDDIDGEVRGNPWLGGTGPNLTEEDLQRLSRAAMGFPDLPAVDPDGTVADLPILQRLGRDALPGEFAPAPAETPTEAEGPAEPADSDG